MMELQLHNILQVIFFSHKGNSKSKELRLGNRSVPNTLGKQDETSLLLTSSNNLLLGDIQPHSAIELFFSSHLLVSYFSDVC